MLTARCEKASTILTTNRTHKHWQEIFNNDTTLTVALLDRLLHHVETIVIEGRSYRTKDQIDPTSTLNQSSPAPRLEQPSDGVLLPPTRKRFSNRQV